jgi:hypothetical protein
MGAPSPQNTDDKRITPAFRAQAGKGRPKGAKNKTTIAVKEAVLAALDKAGGVEYLARQADANPAAFLTLVGKVIPLQVAGDPDNPLKTVTEVRIVGVEP